jgi:hypothetical protein
LHAPARRAESNLVETGFTVRESLGRTIAGLHAPDFKIFDHGVPQNNRVL